MNTVEYLKENGIDVDHGIELLGDIDMYNEILGDFLDESSERLEKLETYKNNNDMVNYAILAHSIKSDSKYLGFTNLAEISLEHELKGKDNDINFVNDNYDKFLEEINRILDISKKYLNR